MQKLNIKVGDTVKVISGESRGSEGKILSIDRSKNRVIVEGVNVVKKHQKPNAANPRVVSLKKRPEFTSLM